MNVFVKTYFVVKDQPQNNTDLRPCHTYIKDTRRAGRNFFFSFSVLLSCVEMYNLRSPGEEMVNTSSFSLCFTTSRRVKIVREKLGNPVLSLKITQSIILTIKWQVIISNTEKYQSQQPSSKCSRVFLAINPNPVQMQLNPIIIAASQCRPARITEAIVIDQQRRLRLLGASGQHPCGIYCLS